MGLPSPKNQSAVLRRICLARVSSLSWVMCSSNLNDHGDPGSQRQVANDERCAPMFQDEASLLTEQRPIHAHRSVFAQDAYTPRRESSEFFVMFAGVRAYSWSLTVHRGFRGLRQPELTLCRHLRELWPGTGIARERDPSSREADGIRGSS